MSNPYQPPSEQPGGQYPQQGHPQQGQPGQQYPGQQQYPGAQGYPQQYSGQAYPGQYPGAQQGLPPQVATPTPPTPVTAAFFCYLATALISLIGVITVLTSDVWEQAIADAGRTATTNSDVSVEQLVSIAKGITIGVGIVFLALYLLFAFKMRAGRNWARITLTVLSALSLISTINATGSVTVNNRVYSATSSEVFGWIGAVLAIAAIVLMFLNPSNEYFRTVKARRMQQKLAQYQG